MNTENNSFAYYSRVLEQPFDSLDELLQAEAKHYDSLKVQKDAETARKNDEAYVEAAYKALARARKAYLENIKCLTNDYQKSLENLKADFQTARANAKAELSKAEAVYEQAVNEFDSAYCDGGYKLTLTDDDGNETTISKSGIGKSHEKFSRTDVQNLLDTIFGDVLWG